MANWLTFPVGKITYNNQFSNMFNETMGNTSILQNTEPNSESLC